MQELTCFYEYYTCKAALPGGPAAILPFSKQTLHACLPGQYASTSSFWAEVRVGEPSSDSGIRGLSTNFAFLRGAKDKKKERKKEKERKAEEGWEKGQRNRGKEKATDGSTYMNDTLCQTQIRLPYFLCQKKKLTAFLIQEMGLV